MNAYSAINPDLFSSTRVDMTIVNKSVNRSIRRRAIRYAGICTRVGISLALARRHELSLMDVVNPITHTMIMVNGACSGFKATNAHNAYARNYLGAIIATFGIETIATFISDRH